MNGNCWKRWKIKSKGAKMLLISESPSGNLILGDRSLEEIEEEKKKFNKLKLLEREDADDRKNV